MNHHPQGNDTYDQRYQGHLSYYNREKEPLDVQNRYSKWDRFEYNHNREFQRSDSRQTCDLRQQRDTDYRSQRWNEVNRDEKSGSRRSECELNESRAYNKYKPFGGRGQSRGRYRGDDRDQQDRGRSWKKRGSLHKMQAKRPSDIEIERHEKKRRLMEGCTFQDGRNRNVEEKLPSNDSVISEIVNLLEKRERSHEKHRSSSRESHGDSRSNSSREGSQSRSSKDKKIVISSKSDSDKSHSNHSSKDARKRHNSSARSSTERQTTESDTSKSTDKVVNTKPNSANELPKQKIDEDKKKEKALCENITIPANPNTSTCALKSVSVNKVSVSNTKSFSKGAQDKSLKSTSKHSNVVHIKPKVSLKKPDSESSGVSSVNKLTDTTHKFSSSSSVSSSNSEPPKKHLPKIPKIPSNTGGSKNVTVHEAKKLSAKHHRHSSGSVPLQPSKTSISSGSSVDGNQLKKKKHRHSSGHVSESSPKKTMVVTSQTVSEVTNIEMDHDATTNILLSERDESLPHLVHRKRHSRITDSKSPPQNNVAEKMEEASGLFQVNEKAIGGKEDGKKVSTTSDEGNHRHKTTHGKENIVTSNVSKIHSKSKDHDKHSHRSKVKPVSKKTVSTSKEPEKHNSSTKTADKEKVLDAAKKSSSLEKHSKSVEVTEEKKSKLTGSHKKEGTGKDSSSNKSHKNPGDVNLEPVVCLKKLSTKTSQKVPSEGKRDKTKPVESIPIEKVEVGSSAPVTSCVDTKDSVSNRERMSLFDLFKDSSEEQKQRKPSKLSLKRTPDKLRKVKPTSSTKPTTEHTKSHKNKRKMEEKSHENLGKKAKLPNHEEVSSIELGSAHACSEVLVDIRESSIGADKSNTICDKIDSEAEKFVSTSVSNQSAMETDISSSGVSEKDMHNESDRSISSSGRQMDESGSGCTSFSLSSCMSSPSFNKSDAMLSDNCSEMETTCNTPELLSGQLHDNGEQIKMNNAECDSNKGMSSLDLYDSCRSLSVPDTNASESDDDDEGGRLVIDFNPSVTSLADTETEKKSTRKDRENMEVRDDSLVPGELETSECLHQVDDVEIPLETRESCLDRTNQMDETLPYNLDDEQNSSVGRRQSAETSKPNLPVNSSGTIPPMDETVPYSSVTSEDSSVDSHQTKVLDHSDSIQKDQPVVSSGNSTEMKGKILNSQDGKNEGSEDTDTRIQSSSPHQDLHQLSHEQTTQIKATVPSSLDTTEESSVNDVQSDHSPKSDTTTQGVPVNDDPKSIDTNESQQMNDNLTFKCPKSNQQKLKQKHSDENITQSDDLVSSQEDMMDVSDFDDKGDIRLIMYNGGDIESPWTPMPATPYVCYSQEDDAQEDESHPEETVKSPFSEGREITQDQETALNLGQGNDKRQDQESDNSSVVEQLEQKPILLPAVSDGKQSSSESNVQIQTDNVVSNASSLHEINAKLSEKISGPEISEFPVAIKVEPVEDACVTVAIEHTPKTHTERIRQAGMIRSSSADQLMVQNRELSQPSIIRSQSVGGESNASLPELRHDRRPSISEDPSPSDVALTTEATATTTATSASGNGTITAIVDSFSVAEISSILKCGTLTAEQHGFLTEVSKGLDHLSVLGCGLLKVPLKHDKISIDNHKFTSFGCFSLVHLKDKSMIRCIECQACADVLSPREFIVHLCGSVRHMQFEIDTLLRTTFEFCTSQSESSVYDRCARALLILIFKLERSIYRSCQQSSVCQTVTSPSAETALSASPLTTPSSAKNLSGAETSSPPVTLGNEQPSFSAASSLVDFLTTDPPTTTQSSSVPSTPQGNDLPSVNTLDETISTSLAFGEYLSNIQAAGGSQLRTGMDGAVVTSAWTQATGQHSLTSQGGGQPLQQHSLTSQGGGQHNGTKSVAPPSDGYGQLPKGPPTGHRSAEMEQMLQCMQQSLSLRRNSQQSFTNIENVPPGSTSVRVRRLSKNAMEGQRSQYGQSRVEDPDSRVYKPPADPIMYQGPSVRDRSRPGPQLAALMIPEVHVQSRPGNNAMPPTSSRTSFNQGHLSSMSSAHSRTLENVNQENVLAANPFQSCSYSTGQMPNHGSSQYMATNSSARFTTGVGYTRPPLNNGPNTTTIPFGPSGNFGPYNRMAAQTSTMGFQSSVSNIGPQGIPGPQYNNATPSHSSFPRTGTTSQCRNGTGPHDRVGPPNVTVPQNMPGPQGSNISGPQSALGPHSSLLSNMLGSHVQQSNTAGLQSTLGSQQSNTIGLQGTLGSQQSNTTGLQSTLGSQQGNTTGLQSTLGSQQSNTAGQQSTLGSQQGNTAGLQSTLGSQQGNTAGLQSTLGSQQSNTAGLQSTLGSQQGNTAGLQSTLDPLNCTSTTTTQRTSGVNSASGPPQPPSVSQSSEAVNGSENNERFSPSVQEKFWVSLGDKIQSEGDAYQMFVMGQMMQRKAVEWFRDKLQTTRVAMEKMDKEHKEEMRKRKESEEIVINQFNQFKSIVETYTKKPS